MLESLRRRLRKVVGDAVSAFTSLHFRDFFYRFLNIKPQLVTAFSSDLAALSRYPG